MVEDTAYQSARWKDHMMYFVPLMQRPPSDDDPIEKDENHVCRARLCWRRPADSGAWKSWRGRRWRGSIRT